ncbi:MAG: DNA polymerase III subunit gamma/tau [Clostridia bacterium]|nr:DNA polymerase III subunit gamma/tau [Clostridia bacterium]
MAYRALYRKYRPLIFADVVGQEHVTDTLKNELANGKTSHAYLFTGSRGTGKTSCAKILARAVNCLDPIDGEPCCKCENCTAALGEELTDIVEIDAASNNGVDNIRELRDQVNFTPSAGKYRVYIIDEVHMLSTAAFNALLKTLEEPPAHVVFILATTEVHKLPATILSRCQRFDFRRIEPQRISARLFEIAEKEGFSLTEDAATLIASAADGGMRDALSILDLCASNSREITEETVANVCAMAGNDYLFNLAGYILDRNTEKALLLLDQLHNSSVDMLRLLHDLTHHYRNLMIIKSIPSGRRPIVCSVGQMRALEGQAARYELSEILSVLNILQDAAGRMQAGDRRCEMEMTVLRLCSPILGNDLQSLERRIAVLEAAAARQPIAVPTKDPQPTVSLDEKPPKQVVEEIPQEVAEDLPEDIPLPDEPQASKPAPLPQIDSDSVAPLENWDEVLRVLRQTGPLIAAVLNDSSAYIKGTYLLIDAPNSQFRDMVSNGMYRDQIRNAAKEVLGVSYKLGPYRAKKDVATEDPLTALAERLKTFELNSD